MTPARLFDFIEYQRVTHPLDRAFGHRDGGEWTYLSTSEVIDQANSLALGLLAEGIRPGDRIASAVYKASSDWVVFDLALLLVGAIHVPMYPTISPREYEFILKDSAAVLCFVGEGDLFQKVKNAQPNCPALREIFTFKKEVGFRFYRDLMQKSTDFSEIERIKASIKPNDLATIIYTSGTTGNPKGVMLSHRNIVSNVLAVHQILPVSAGDRGLSFLPVCHVFERVCVYAYTMFCVSVTFTGTDNLGGDDGDLKAIRPHFFTTVPRLLEKVFDKIMAKGLELKGIKRALFFWAMRLTDDFEYDKTYSGWRGIQQKIADKLIFSKWRAALGGELKGIVTGAAPCPMKIARVFSAAGVPIREGYGLTESSPGICISRFKKGLALLGTVGPPIADDIILKIDHSDGEYRPGEGEILCSGPNVMLGYFNQPEQTAAVLAEIDGKIWLKTGDIGTLVERGGVQFLKITDRKKELFKTSGGKYVAPAPLESRLKEEFLIEQAMAVGDNMKFVSALLVPSPDALKNWCERHQIAWTNLDEAVKNPQVIARFQQLLDKVNPEFGHVDQIKKFTLLARPWEPVKADGSDAELTPTLKLKRRVILKKCAAEIEAMYA